ncbi:hypothetical protein BD413DRAFT_487895 [Trametes elegans]|nr:hypothetical protein BD413DRAFT_487895 [Trametes elegans]
MAALPLPVELLAHVLSFLRTDLDALRSVCLASHVLHAVLFAVRDLRTVDRGYLKPFLPLPISSRPDMHRDRDVHVLTRDLAPSLSPHITPRLHTLLVRGIGSSGMAYLSTLAALFKSFPSLTTLVLNETTHRDMHDVQLLISSLPHLAHLSLNALTWISPDYDDEPDNEPDLFHRPALNSLRVSPVYPSCMLSLLSSLARTPTAHTLRTLDVPATAHIRSGALSPFGPSLRHLSVPLRTLRPTDLARYPALQSLTLFLGRDDCHSHHPSHLPDILAALPHLSHPDRAPVPLTVTIHLPSDPTCATDRALDMLARVDKALFGDASAVPELTLVFLCARAFDNRDGSSDAPLADWRARLRMPRAAALGRLAVRVERDERSVARGARSVPRSEALTSLGSWGFQIGRGGTATWW